VNPNTVISSTSAAVNGLTYAQVIQKAVDSFTWGQTGPDYGNRYGGWRYYASSNDSDMSTTQWAPISYYFASQVPGVQTPLNASYDPLNKVRTALQAWLTADQVASGPNKGAVDYQPGYGILNDTHLGGFLVSNKFAGGGGSQADALAYLNANWPGIVGNPGWVGANNEGNPYAIWAIYKGLETLYGTTGVNGITNLNPLTTALDSGVTYNWWEDYCQYLIGIQNGNGSWSGADYWTGDMATAWSINILNATATVTPPPPPGVPEPATLLLLGLGLAGLGAIRKKM
jgi:hypothetical protein